MVSNVLVFPPQRKKTRKSRYAFVVHDPNWIMCVGEISLKRSIVLIQLGNNFIME